MTKTAGSDVLAAIDAALDDNLRALHARQLEDMLDAVFGGPSRVRESYNGTCGCPIIRAEEGDVFEVEECRVITRKIDVTGLNGGSYSRPGCGTSVEDFQRRNGFRYDEPWTVHDEPDYDPHDATPCRCFFCRTPPDRNQAVAGRDIPLVVNITTGVWAPDLWETPAIFDEARAARWTRGVQ